MNSNVRIGLALSGGGFRAAAFHLGVLKSLEELNILPFIKALSTVSGGSITGALYAYRCAQRNGKPGSYPIDKLIDEMTPFLKLNLRGKALFGNPLKITKTILSFITPWVSRANLIETHLNKELFRYAKLSDLPNWICINSINLRTGKNWKFYHNMAGDYLIGATKDVGTIRISEAVTASAAFPGLMEPYLFKSNWESLSIKQLPRIRWDNSRSTTITNKWRERYGKPNGRVVIPLMDGGLYDNTGVVSLRSAKITHPILADASPSEGDEIPLSWISGLEKALALSNNRLGSITRQWIHESTHSYDPNNARKRLIELSKETKHNNPTLSKELNEIANVGWPPRGRQFNSVVQILLHSQNIAQNFCNSHKFENRWNIPDDDRGLSENLVPLLSQIRTDLDAFSSDAIDLLIAQGYLITDAYMKIGMNDILKVTMQLRDPRAENESPSWRWAKDVVSKANEDPNSGIWLKKEAKRKLLGRYKS